MLAAIGSLISRLLLRHWLTAAECCPVAMFRPVHLTSTSTAPLSGPPSSSLGASADSQCLSRVTVIPFLPPSSSPAGYGVLLPLPSRHSSLLAELAASFRLPSGVERCIRLFVDEGADNSNASPNVSASGGAVSAVGSSSGSSGSSSNSSSSSGARSGAVFDYSCSALWTSRRGGEVSERTFHLLRDNDVLHALLPSDEHSAEHSSGSSGSTGSGSTRRIELRVVDASGGGTLRFQINPRKKLAQLLSKYETHKGWDAGSLTLASRRRRQQHNQHRTQHDTQYYQGDDEEEVQLSGQETCESCGLSDGALLYAYKRV